MQPLPMPRMLLAALIGLTVALAAGVSPAAAPPAAAASTTDWPQWRGPERTGISAETGWMAQWPAPPRTVWKAAVGEGYSSVAVAAGRVYTMGFSGGQDAVWCFDAATGRLVWKQSYPCEAGEYPGPRCTPTVDGDKVYTLSRLGELHCFDAATGKIAWNVNVAKVAAAKRPQWAFACSPLVLGKQVIVDVGPIVALDKADGKLAWKAGEDLAGYGSPLAFTLNGATMIASFNDYGPIVVDPAGPKVVARARWQTQYGVNAVTPIVQGDTLFISSGYNRGAALFQIAGDALKPVWENKNMRNHTNNCVLWNGCLYGFDGQVDQGALTCLDYKTGERKWVEKTVKAGALMLADGKLIVQSSKGDLIVAEASPAAYKELARAPVLTGTCWTTPVLSGGRIFCRNHKGDLVCVDVAGK